MSEIETATHGQPARDINSPANIAARRALGAPYVVIGHSHDHTPRPFWRRWWLRLRGKWPVRYHVAGAVLPGFALGYNQGPSKWDRGQQIDIYKLAAAQITAKFTPDDEASMAAFKRYCEQDVKLERRMHIACTQPAARFAADGSIYYDSWHWTGRTK